MHSKDSDTFSISRLLLPGSAIIFLVSIAALIFLGIERVPKLLPLTTAQARLAEWGVSNNAEWEPVLRRIEGVDMVLVPSGCFMMGSTDEQIQEALESCDRYYGALGCLEDFKHEQPVHEVCITEPYWFDLTPVTNRQVVRYPQKNELQEGYRESGYPRSSVTWRQAADICAWRGARLPTEAEWEFAARGPDALIYPYGDEYDIHKPTLRKISPAEVGQKPEGASWVGALDMSGGISEWVADYYGGYPSESQTDPRGPIDGEQRVARGGSWFAHAAYFVRTTYREVLSPDHATSTVGLRCARDYIP